MKKKNRLESIRGTENRVRDLLSRMSLDDKIGQMTQLDVRLNDVEDYVESGATGSLLCTVGPERINALQRLAIEKSPLGIPLLMARDVIHGFRTLFPIPLAYSCSWNSAFVEEISRIAAEESASQGLHWILSPVADICRDPRWGRIAEGAGEDPFLCAEMAKAQVRGFQAANIMPGRRMAACVKHFAGYGAVESGKDYNTVDLSERTLREIHLPPFRAALDEGAMSLMVSFNEISGIPSSMNGFLLRTVLRDEWKSTTVVLSDYSAIKEVMAHGSATDLKDAARLCALAGIDIDMMSLAYYHHLADLVKEGAVPIKIINEAVSRILRLKFSLGVFERPYVETNHKAQVLVTAEYREKALAAALESIVLLKNDNGSLPLTSPIKKLAVIGPLSHTSGDLLGCWRADGKDSDAMTILEAMQKESAGSFEIIHANGCEIEGGTEDGLAEAIKVAADSDTVVMVLGERADQSGEAHCRAHLGLPGFQQTLLEKVCALGKPVIVVLLVGRPLVIPWMAKHVPAILLAWHGGIETGRATSRILLGKSNPCGKLTVGFPRCEGQIPVYYAHKNTGRPSTGPGTIQFNKRHVSAYLDEPNTPLFPFGYGLSYTRFVYENLRIYTPKIKISGIVKISVQLTNAGSRDGVEIVQLYIRDLVGSVTRPVKELKAFERVSLAAGETRLVKFSVPVQELGFIGQDLKYRVEPGEFQVWVGPDSTEGLNARFLVWECT